MIFVIENRPRVYDDITEAVEYYYPINQKLAEDFLDRIEEAKQFILNSPKGFEEKYKNVRTILLKQFPYHIYYTIDDKKIIILGILHAQIGKERIGEM